MKRILLIFMFLPCVFSLFSQIDPALLKEVPGDSAMAKLSMDAVYSRPMLTSGKLPVTLGGYLEANWLNSSTDGVSEGNQFQFRRFTMFITSTITRRIKFMSEMEFEDGTKEIALEFAAIDVEFTPLFNFRGGIILNPIGAFNQNHDGPKWEFTDRPISATQMLPATFSNAGFGFFGKIYRGSWMFGYEAYLSNGLNNFIIENEENKTFLPAAKTDPFRFEESFNGKPLFTGKLAMRNSKTGEIGISFMGGIYNKYKSEGLIIDEKRACNVLALDYNHTIPGINTFITAEWAWIYADVPSTYTEQFGSRQQGGFIDIVQPFWKTSILEWDGATFNVACRLEYVDWNKGSFKSTGGNIFEETWSIMPAFSFRPTSQTVFRFNYRYQRTRDIFGNPPSITGTYSLGLSTYF
jgi:hypothetical protein